MERSYNDAIQFHNWHTLEINTNYNIHEKFVNMSRTGQCNNPAVVHTQFVYSIGETIGICMAKTLASSFKSLKKYTNVPFNARYVIYTDTACLIGSHRSVAVTVVTHSSSCIKHCL